MNISVAVVEHTGFCANQTLLEQTTLICNASGADVVGMCSPKSWNIVVSPDNTTRVNVFLVDTSVALHDPLGESVVENSGICANETSVE